MGLSFFLVNEKYCIIKLYNYNKENIKIVNMKTKNILKIGVFSIVILVLLISPIFKSNILEVYGNGPLSETHPEQWSQVETMIHETSTVDICEGVGDDTWSIWEAASVGWWEHKMCVFQKGILEGLGKMFAAIINSQTTLIIWAFDPATYGGFVNNDAVQSIWGLMRNLINLILILSLVIIAIATILGYKKYAWKQILWKLIVVALLINFSLVIAGMILDVSNFLAYNFLNAAKRDNDNLAQSMISTFETEKLSGPEKYEITALPPVKQEVKSGWGMSWGNFLIAFFSLVLIGIFALIALLAIFVAMIVRSFMLIALLCVSPVAFAAWIFPDTIKYWKMWWDQFIKWCTFPIIFGLMLYIGIFAVNKLGITAGDTELGMIPFIIRVFLFSMFLVGGLIFSLQGGGALSQMVMKQASKIGAAAGAFATKKTAGAITESSTYKKAGKFLAKVPLLGGVGQEMMVAGEKAKATRVKEHEENLKNVGLGNLQQLEKAPAPSPLDRNAYERRIALANKLADMGELSQESVEFIKMHQGDERLNKKAITEAIPHHFKLEDGQLVETSRDIAEKAEILSRIKPDKIRDKTQTSDFIKDIIAEKEEEARKQDKSEQEIKNAGDKAFDETVQEIVKKLSPAQLAGWWQGVSPKDMVEGEWGGPEGKIAQAIRNDKQAEKKFYEEAIPSSQVLRAASGIGIKKEKEQNKKPKETPPHPGWTKQGGIWRSPEE
jgi:hypothetical protein